MRQEFKKSGWLVAQTKGTPD